MQKKLLLIIACFLPMLVVPQVKYGVNAGTTFSWYRSSTDEGIIPEYSTLAGFQVGIFAETALNNYFFIQPELLFSTRGAKSEISQTYNIPTSTGYTREQIKLKSNIIPLYLNLPVYLKASFHTVGSNRFCIGAGPLFSYGVGGKIKIKGSVNGTDVTGEMMIFREDKLTLKDSEGNRHNTDAPALLERFDVGISCFASYEFTRFMLNLNYLYGLKNINKDADEDIWNRGLTISLGYRL